MESELDRLAARALERRTEDKLLRRRRVVERVDAAHVLIEGKPYVNFSTNDYLGLSCHPKLIEAIQRSARRSGAGSGASALVTGSTIEHEEAERNLAQWKGTAGAVLLPSGYQANHAAVQAIAGAAEAVGRRARFLLDKLVHASLIDAVRGSEQPYRVFGHNDMQKLERLLSEPESADQLQVIVTESIFSMDGDAAKLAEIVALKKKHGAVLLVDEAHASGVYGKNGSGLAAEIGLTDEVDVFVVTLSKAMGCVGGAVCGAQSVCELVENFARAYIYSTAVPGFVGAACSAAIGVMEREPERQERVKSLARRVREELKIHGRDAHATPAEDSPIVPIVVGSEEKALAMAEGLSERRMLVAAVRPPTVAKGTSRLRVTLSAAHSDEEVGILIDALKEKPM